MNQPCSTRYFESLVAFSLALATLPALAAQPQCPGNTASVTPRFVQRALIVIPVVARRFRGRPERTTPRGDAGQSSPCGCTPESPARTENCAECE